MEFHLKLKFDNLILVAKTKTTIEMFNLKLKFDNLILVAN